MLLVNMSGIHLNTFTRQGGSAYVGTSLRSISQIINRTAGDPEAETETKHTAKAQKETDKRQIHTENTEPGSRLPAFSSLPITLRVPTRANHPAGHVVFPRSCRRPEGGIG